MSGLERLKSRVCTYEYSIHVNYKIHVYYCEDTSAVNGWCSVFIFVFFFCFFFFHFFPKPQYANDIAKNNKNQL